MAAEGIGEVPGACEKRVKKSSFLFLQLTRNNRGLPGANGESLAAGGCADAMEPARLSHVIALAN